MGPQGQLYFAWKESGGSVRAQAVLGKCDILRTLISFSGGGDVEKEADKLDLKSPKAGSFSLMGEGLPLTLSAELPLGWASGAVCGMHECADKQKEPFPGAHSPVMGIVLLSTDQNKVLHIPFCITLQHWVF